MKQIHIFLVIIFISFSALHAEEPVTTRMLSNNNVEFKKKNFRGEEQTFSYAMRELAFGDQFFDMGSWMYVNAIQHYLVAWEFNPNNALLNYKLGVAHLETYDKQDAVFFLERSLMLDPDAQDDIYYLLGQAYHYDHNFDAAINAYYTFLETAPIAMLDNYYADVQKKIAEARYAKDLVANPVNVAIYPLNNAVNSVYPDYCPVITPDGNYMVFTARRSNTTGGRRDMRDYKYNEDIFYSTRVDGQWQLAQNTNMNFNSKSHDATVGISSDGKKMLIYKGDKGGDIWESFNVNGQWQEPYILNNTINTKYQETSASYSPDGKLLYFVSNKPGGIGGKDIYVSELQSNGTWGKSFNIGSSVNTIYDEEAVFMAADGKTLYFSSKGHQTMGGYDIFKTEYIDGIWTAPENLGYPINTADDDIFFVVDATVNTAYYSSERADGFGSQDIYTIEFLKEEILRQIVLDTRVVDELYKLPLESVYFNVTDDETGEIIATFEHKGSEDHKFKVNLLEGRSYTLYAASPGFEPKTETLIVEFPENNYEVIEKEIELGYLNLSSIILPTVYFDFDKYNLRPESVEEINNVIEILNTYSSAHIEIAGHTDVIGNYDYNIWLSHKRSYVVANYMTQNGIERGRLHLIWFSYDLPASENETDDGRQLNRRTEFRLFLP